MGIHIIKSGIASWLAKIDLDNFEIQRLFTTEEGIQEKLTVFIPDCHLRLKWKPNNWEKQSTVEIRITNSKRQG